jgi:hypothetical protein
MVRCNDCEKAFRKGKGMSWAHHICNSCWHKRGCVFDDDLKN